MKLEGIISAMVTPLFEDETVNENGLRYLVRHLINHGIHGLFCLGTTGEFYALSTDEKIFITQIVMDEAGGRVPVYAGTGAASTKEVIALTKTLEKINIAGVSVVTPYYITPSQKQLYEHYKSISESVSVPVILYNIPSRTGVDIHPETAARLAELPNIIGIKDSSGKFENIKAYIDMSSGLDFSVLAGSDILILKTLEHGGKGAVAATTNIFPDIVVSIYENYINNDMVKAKEAQDKIAVLSAAIKPGTVPGALKQASVIAGIPAGPAKKPVCGLEGELLKELEKVVRGGITR